MRDPYLYDDVGVLRNLGNIRDAEELRRAEGDVTRHTMAMVYAHHFAKFNTETLREIHRIVFDHLFEWAGEFRTIPLIKHEDVLGGDTVRYALVWASQGMYAKPAYLERIFLDAAGVDVGEENLHMVVPKDYTHIEGYFVADYKEQPHKYLDDHSEAH